MPQIRYWHPSDERFVRSYSTGANFAGCTQSCLVIPCASLASARRRLKWERLSREQKVERVAVALNGSRHWTSKAQRRVRMDDARALLAAIYGEGV